MQANGLKDSTIFVGQTLIIPIEVTPERVEGLRGILSVMLYNQSDGGHSTEFGFSDPAHSYMMLKGDNLQELENYQNRPVDIWGTITPDETGILTVQVERYEIPFPELNFQILSGIDKKVNIEGETVRLFTSDDGQSFVELLGDCYNPVTPSSVAGDGEIGKPILLEALVLPNLTYGGYPAICVSSTALALDSSGQPVELLVTADQPYVMDEPPSAVSSQAPSMTIEKVELIYYIPDQRYATPDENTPAYVQPMWRFYGHYNNGDEFEFLVQALKDEFLSPEIQYMDGPG